MAAPCQTIRSLEFTTYPSPHCARNLKLSQVLVPPQVTDFASSGRRRQRRCAATRTNVRVTAADAEQLAHEHKAYVDLLRSLLVE